jgi:hypothetical protein
MIRDMIALLGLDNKTGPSLGEKARGDQRGSALTVRRSHARAFVPGPNE